MFWLRRLLWCTSSFSGVKKSARSVALLTVFASDVQHSSLFWATHPLHSCRHHGWTATNVFRFDLVDHLLPPVNSLTMIRAAVDTQCGHKEAEVSWWKWTQAVSTPTPCPPSRKSQFFRLPTTSSTIIIPSNNPTHHRSLYPLSTNTASN